MASDGTALRTAAPGRAGASSSAEVRVRGEGGSGEGRVRAVAVTGGRIETLDIDPRVLRLEPEELAAHVSDALDFALDDVRARAGAELADGAGRVEAVLLNARSLRMASHALAATIVTTANEALGSARADATQRSKAAAGPDLQERVRAMQDQSIEQLRSLTGSLTALMSGIQKR